jgi:hypothetical protein
MDLRFGSITRKSGWLLKNKCSSQKVISQALVGFAGKAHFAADS